MVCELRDAPLAALWPALLELRRFLATDEARGVRYVTFARRQGAWSFAADGSMADC